MIKEIKATVYYNDIPAGELIKNPSGYIFRYFDSYLYERKYPAISLSFPKRMESFYSNVLFPFFYGLLTEGENKDIICRTKKIDKYDHFSLLINSATNDTIGAITIRGVQG